MAVPIAVSFAVALDKLAANIRFDASPCSCTKVLVAKVPVCVLNLKCVAFTSNIVPTKPPDCVSTAPSTNSAGIEGEPVNATSNE